MTDDEIIAFCLKLRNGAKNIYWRDCDGLVFRVIGFHPAYAEGDDVPEPVAVLEGNKTASLLNSTTEEYYELVPLQLTSPSITEKVQITVHDAIVSDDRGGATYERVTDALLEDYEMFQSEHLVDRIRVKNVVGDAISHSTIVPGRPSDIITLALFNNFKITPKRT